MIRPAWPLQQGWSQKAAIAFSAEGQALYPMSLPICEFEYGQMSQLWFLFGKRYIVIVAEGVFL